MSNNIFGVHRINALILFLIAAVIWWYALLLMTNPKDGSVWPDKNQWIGLIIAVIIGFVSWISKCFTIIPRD